MCAWYRPFVLLLVAILSGCVAVKLERQDLQFSSRGASAGEALSRDTIQSLSVIGISTERCIVRYEACTESLRSAAGLAEEARLSAESNVWLFVGHRLGEIGGVREERALDAYLKSARSAYSYLFFTTRSAGERAFETRQQQVAAFYNAAVARATEILFTRMPDLRGSWESWHVGDWEIVRPEADTHGRVPLELVDAESLRFAGLSNVYRRDGVGAPFVARFADVPADADRAPAWHEPSHAALTITFSFSGRTSSETSGSRRVSIVASDPYRSDRVEIEGRSVPLAANFTAPYGFWLAHSLFGQQALLSLFGRRGAIPKARVLLMAPYDPGRTTIIMIHGLASSPNAWVNLGNELLGDDRLRAAYQVWQVYYPTNAPLAANLLDIRRAIEATFDHFDPDRRSRASHHVVLIGHSMGGVLARLLVSASTGELDSVVRRRKDMRRPEADALAASLAPYLRFSPLPEVSRAIFMAAPHRGTPFALNRLSRLVSRLMRLPAFFWEANRTVIAAMGNAAPPDAPMRLPNSVDNLSEKDPFIRASSLLPISEKVVFHTIVGNTVDSLLRARYSDGVVPYWSAHLDGAVSELIVPSGHGVQKSVDAILETRRILRLHLEGLDDTHRVSD